MSLFGRLSQELVDHILITGGDWTGDDIKNMADYDRALAKTILELPKQGELHVRMDGTFSPVKWRIFPQAWDGLITILGDSLQAGYASCQKGGLCDRHGFNHHDPEVLLRLLQQHETT